MILVLIWGASPHITSSTTIGASPIVIVLLKGVAPLSCTSITGVGPPDNIFKMKKGKIKQVFIFEIFLKNSELCKFNSRFPPKNGLFFQR